MKFRSYGFSWPDLRCSILPDIYPISVQGIVLSFLNLNFINLINGFFNNRKKFKWAMGFVTTAATGLSFWHPAANAFVMMFLAVPGNILNIV